MPPNTETLDKLYLEWSQFTKARTRREGDMKRVIMDLIRDADDDQTRDRARSILNDFDSN